MRTLLRVLSMLVTTSHVAWEAGPDYSQTAGLPSQSPLSEELRAAIRLADWVAGLHEATFDLARWHTVGQELEAARAFHRLRSIAQLCFPSDATNVPEPP